MPNPPKLPQGLQLNQLLDFGACLYGGLERQATIQLGQEGTGGLLEDPLELLKAEFARGIQSLVAEVFAIRRRCLPQRDIQCHACQVAQHLGFATKEGRRFIPTLLHVGKHIHVKSRQHLLNTLCTGLQLQEVDGRHLLVLLESLLGQDQLRKDIILLHTLLIGNSRQDDILQILIPHHPQRLKQGEKRNRLVIAGSRNDGHTLATAFRTRRHDHEMRLRSNGTIIRNRANPGLGLLVGLLLGLLNLQRRSMLNQRLGTAFTLAHIGTLACLLEVIAQPFLGQHDLLGSSNDEVASQLVATLTGLKGLFGLQLGQPALTASKHERNPSQQDIVQRLGQDLGAHRVFHQQRHSNL